MKVVVNTPNSISVKVNQAQQETVHGTSTFVGASNEAQAIQGAYNTANTALAVAEASANQVGYAANLAIAASTTANAAFIEANSAYAYANTRYSANGGIIYGNVTVAGNILPQSANTYYLGSPQYPFHSLYVGPGTVYIDNISLSNSNGQLLITGSNSLNVAGDMQVSGVFYGTVATIDGGIFS